MTLAHKEQATRLLSYMCFYSSKNQELIGTPAVAAAIVANLALDSKRLQYYTEGLIWSLAHNSKKRRAILVNAGAVAAVGLPARPIGPSRTFRLSHPGPQREGQGAMQQHRQRLIGRARYLRPITSASLIFKSELTWKEMYYM